MTHPIRALVIAILLVAAVAPAQDDRPVLDVDVLFTLRAVDGATGVLDVGEDAGVVVGGRRVIYRVSSTEGTEQVGEAELASVTADSCIVSLYAFQGAILADGDQVELRLRVPRPERDQIAWRLAENAIVLKEVGGTVLLDPADVFADPDADHDTPLLQACADMCREVVPYIEDWEEMENEQGGRYAGRTMRDILENAVPEDMEDFLLFVLSYPGK